MAKHGSSRRFSYIHVIGAFLVGCAASCLLLMFFLTGHHLDGLVGVGVGTSSSSYDGNTLSSSNNRNKAGVHQMVAAAGAANFGADVATDTDNGIAEQIQQRPYHDEHHPVAGLDCVAHGGGPTDPSALTEMVYWRDIPQDNQRIDTLDPIQSKSSTWWRSPFNRRLWKDDKNQQQQQQQQRQYLTFEPDGGGFNNIRMSLETVITMAVAMGRVLVLPPAQKMYLLGKVPLQFGDFFPMHAISKEHLEGVGLEIITTEQFLQEIQSNSQSNNGDSIGNDDLASKLKDHPIPQDGRTNWDGDTTAVKQTLNPWLRSIATAPGDDWDPRFCVAAFPKSSDPQDIESLRTTHQELLDELSNGDKNKLKDVLSKLPESFINKPTPVNASTKERLKEFLAGRTKLCVYDQRLQDASIIHFHGKAANLKHQSKEKQQELSAGGGRLLVHFYAFLFFQDYKADLWMKRFARDHIRYKDDIQCAAARVVEAVRQISRSNSGDTQGSFDAFHVRRGDFQYKKTRVSAEELVAMAKNEIAPGRTVYVGTDERNKQFFEPLRQHGWKVLFLDDFIEQGLLKDIDSHYYGMIDQLITSRSDVFFGCWFSTFTGYITRIRGYHSQRLDDHVTNQRKNDELIKAHSQGKLPKSYYYALKEDKTRLHDYWPIKQAFYAREFPTSWWQLDWDVDTPTS